MSGHPLLADAIFLRRHPGWSPHDLAGADQDLLDLMVALDHEAGRQQERQRAMAEGMASVHRRR